jgi:ABC-2 type transport system ATP-binding protein
VIEVENLTKRYGDRVAVEDLSFVVKPGVVTGFLGPNGSGKSTTMRLILGLDAPTAGTALVGGRAYRDIPDPLHEIGAMLEAHAIHTGRSARNHLRALAATHNISDGRVEEVIDLVGLTEVARKRVGTFSLGMGQRLGIASSLLGDPKTVVLDEPVNGLDPEGIRWVRDTFRAFADEGRTVLVSSHLLSEMALTADHLLVLGRGQLIADASTRDLIAQNSTSSVLVRSPQAPRLAELFERAGGQVQQEPDGALRIRGFTTAQIADRAAAAALPVHELTVDTPSLEAAFLELTGDSTEFRLDPSEPAYTTVGAPR